MIFLYNSGFTILLCVPPRIAVTIVYPINLLVFVFYGILNHGPLKKYQIENHHRDTEYKRVSLEDKDHNKQQRHHSTSIQLLQFLYVVFPYFGYYFISFCTLHIVTGSVLTTVSFPSSPFRIRDHYHYYRVCHDVGMVLGGSEVLVVSCLCPAWLSVFRIRRIWILALISVGHLMFFLFAAWYHFVPNVFILLVLCVTNGFVFGLINVHGMIEAADQFQDIYRKGLAINFVELGCAIGRLVSGLLGIFVEEYLRVHCTNNLLMGEYCLARFKESIGWNKNFQCQ